MQISAMRFFVSGMGVSPKTLCVGLALAFAVTGTSAVPVSAMLGSAASVGGLTVNAATPGTVPGHDGLAMHAATADSLDGPEAVAVAYLDAFRRTDWQQCAGLMHPDALQSLKDVLIEAVETGKGRGIPDALYGDNTPPETIRFAPPAELYARMLRVVYRRTEPAAQVLGGLSSEVLGHVRETDRLVHVVARTRVRTTTPPAADAGPSSAAPANESADRTALSQVEVLTLQRYRDTWRLRLTTDVKNVARAVRE